jgi:hypothetical protein
LPFKQKGVILTRRAVLLGAGGAAQVQPRCPVTKTTLFNLFSWLHRHPVIIPLNFRFWWWLKLNRRKGLSPSHHFPY